ncbi:molybdenum cofactor guanylyltransferase MobA [Pseudohongiella sp.]|uniref:MobA-like NTP transferase domain-containing protein n=1 Tax=marine sediment metagenome TaxID=412755 RepID=A0A0F9W6I7_9ZZZZ|nr:molybdenum cofactor guanylyltransferase MobA [Pseudohongiella sp.]HDZ09496.1 molybdenum cofactor guanylyltransferase [Pseudohongiella sp.]HEA63932.1 molybdenum cofactor guanylyltransferase [Pseudohongiella sp.]
MSASATAYTLIVLAGGQGSRMGGCDKGLLPFGEHSFVEILVQRLRCTVPGADHVLISANRNHDEYNRMDAQVCPDLRAGFQGPLAGLEATLAQAPCHQPVVVVPCDMPLLPQRLPDRLLQPVLANSRSIAVLHDGRRRQHLCLAMWPQQALPTIRDTLGRGQRSVANWLSGQWVTDVSCHEMTGADIQAMLNVNDPGDFSSLAAC